MSWEEQKHIVAFAVVSYRSEGAEKPEFGTIKIEAATQVAMADRLASFAPLRITQANFPSLSKQERPPSGFFGTLSSGYEKLGGFHCGCVTHGYSRAGSP